MARRCKNCDPNKYIDGMAWRGANGHDFENFNVFNDIGEPADLGILANVPDMVDAYNPIFSSTLGKQLPSVQDGEQYIKGIDRTQGFWFIWDFSKGMVAYGSPGSTIANPIISDFHIDYTNVTPDVGKYDGEITNEFPNGNLWGPIRAEYTKASGSKDIIVTVKDKDGIGIGQHNLYVTENPNLNICFNSLGSGYYTSPESNRIYTFNKNQTPYILAGLGDIGAGLGTTLIKESDKSFYSSSAIFNRPRGICINTGTNDIYVADTDNHRICKITQGLSSVIGSDKYFRSETTLFAGKSSITGLSDGIGSEAEFNRPQNIIIDYNRNNLYVADTDNHTIRRITLTGNVGEVRTIAGKAMEFGTGDSQIGTGARFHFPQSLTIANETGLYVADTSNNTIRVIDLNPNLDFPVQTIIGQAGQPGYLDAVGNNARLNCPLSLCTESGNLLDKGHSTIFIADYRNHCIRKLNLTTNEVTTFAGKGQSAGNGIKPTNSYGTYSQNGSTITINIPNGHGYTSDNNIGTEIYLEFLNGGVNSGYYIILSVPNGSTLTVGTTIPQNTTGTVFISSLRTSRLNRPAAISEDIYGNLYIVNFTNNINVNSIRKITGKNIQFIEITYTQPINNTRITCTLSNHKLSVGDAIYLRFKTGNRTPFTGNYLIASVTQNTFEIDIGNNKVSTVSNGTAEIIPILYDSPQNFNAKKEFDSANQLALKNYFYRDQRSSIYFDDRSTLKLLKSNYFTIKSILDKSTFIIQDTEEAIVDINNPQPARLNFASRLTTSALGNSYTTDQPFPIDFAGKNEGILPRDILKFNSATPTSTISYLSKKEISKVGYYSGRITVTAINTTNAAASDAIFSRQYRTIQVRDSLNNSPIQVTSSPILVCYKGQLAYYKFTTNIKNGLWYVGSERGQKILSESVINELNRLGLIYDELTQSISGLIKDNIPSDLITKDLSFVVSNDDIGRGQKTTFTLTLLIGEQPLSTALKPKPVRTKLSYIYDNFNISDKGTAPLPNDKLDFRPYFTNMDGEDKNDTIKLFKINCTTGAGTFLDGLTFDNGVFTGSLKNCGRYEFKMCAVNKKGKSEDLTIIFHVNNYYANQGGAPATFPTDLKLFVAPFENIAQHTISIKFRTFGDEIFEFKKIADSEVDYIIKNGRPETLPNRELNFNPDDRSDTYKKGRDMSYVSFRPGIDRTRESKFWFYVDDPTPNTQAGVTPQGTRPELFINVEGSYSLTDGFSPFIDALGNLCYKPQQSVSAGPVSNPIYQDLTLLATSCIKDAFSNNDAENLPNISFLVQETAVNVEHQVYFFVVKDGNLKTTGSVAKQTLSKSNLPKFPNGIPASGGTYIFYVRIADTCSFNFEIKSGSYQYQPIALYIGTYRPTAGDVYSCAFERFCFPKDTKVFTPNGYKNIQDFKINDEIYCYDDDENLKISKVYDVIDHQLVPQPLYKIIFENGKIIKSTLDHPFFIEKNKYIPLRDLKPGDYLTTFDKKRIKILDIVYDGEEPVYNLSVEEYNNYIAEDIFVHNIGNLSAKAAFVLFAKGRYVSYENVTLTSSAVPSNCGRIVSQIGNSKKLPGYGFRYTNSFLDSKDIGILTLTNISVLDLLCEGPIEGITDYNIIPNNDDKDPIKKGDIGYKYGVKIDKFPGRNSFIRSIYWNETPIADNTYPNNGSLNFDFVKLKIENYDKSPEHTNSQNLENIKISEDLNTNKVGNGVPLDSIFLKENDDRIISQKAKIPKILTVTKTIGQKIFGKRVFSDGSSRTYKKSFNIMTQDLYGLRFHVKIAGLNKTIVDLTIWESYDAGENNATSGRVDRIGAYFNLKLKKINRGINGEGQRIIPVEYKKNGITSDTWRLNCVGKILKGGFIETFEWLGLNKIADADTIGWEIEVEALHEEPVDPNVILETYADSITELYQDKLVFPYTASVLSTFDARYFQSIPQRYYDTRLLKVKIPSNYNPFSKTYDGNWDGTFNIGWTDNPAWCFYDIVTNNRFGLGKYIESKYIDKWTLYDVSKYCDQLVSDGRGGLEPRFTCNVLISTREDAYKVLNDMASIFRAIIYYNAGSIFVSQDKPKDPIYIFNNSNVKNGEFTYNDTSKRVRRNTILVRYNDKNNFYKPAVKYVENREGLIRFGIKEMDITAFGCTSEGQAERLGKWTLLSENIESEVVTFETSLPAMYLKPGDVILLQDQDRQNKVLAGRTLDLNKEYAILDIKYENIKPYEDIISGCTFNILTPAGNIEIGTPSGIKALDLYDSNPTGINLDININGIKTPVNQVGESLIRRSQIQSRVLGSTINNNRFFNYVSEETGINFSGFTKINLSAEKGIIPLDDTQHTLLKNTVWTLELDPNSYNYLQSPSVKDSSSQIYPGAMLESYLDKTQKFRILDIEEKEEYSYKITALQYNQDKFSITDEI